MTDEIREAIEKGYSMLVREPIKIDELPEDPQELLNLMRNLFVHAFNYYQNPTELIAYTAGGEDLSAPVRTRWGEEPRNSDHDYAATQEILRVSNNRVGIPVDAKNQVYVSYEYNPETQEFDRYYFHRKFQQVYHVDGVELSKPRKEEIWEEVELRSGKWVPTGKTIKIPVSPKKPDRGSSRRRFKPGRGSFPAIIPLAFGSSTLNMVLLIASVGALVLFITLRLAYRTRKFQAFLRTHPKIQEILGWLFGLAPEEREIAEILLRNPPIPFHILPS